MNAVVIAPILNPIAELVIPIGIPSKETKADFEIHLLTAKAKKKKKKMFNIMQNIMQNLANVFVLLTY